MCLLPLFKQPSARNASKTDRRFGRWGHLGLDLVSAMSRLLRSKRSRHRWVWVVRDTQGLARCRSHRARATRSRPSGACCVSGSLRSPEVMRGDCVGTVSGFLWTSMSRPFRAEIGTRLPFDRLRAGETVLPLRSLHRAALATARAGQGSGEVQGRLRRRLGQTARQQAQEDPQTRPARQQVGALAFVG